MRANFDLENSWNTHLSTWPSQPQSLTVFLVPSGTMRLTWILHAGLASHLSLLLSLGRGRLSPLPPPRVTSIPHWPLCVAATRIPISTFWERVDHVMPLCSEQTSYRKNQLEGGEVTRYWSVTIHSVSLLLPGYGLDWSITSHPHWTLYVSLYTTVLSMLREDGTKSYMWIGQVNCKASHASKATILLLTCCLLHGTVLSGWGHMGWWEGFRPI